MLIPHLERFLTEKLSENKRQNRIYLLFWLILSLCFAAVYIAKQSILVGKEYTLPFHTKYYAQFSQRMTDLINAQYSQDISQVVNFIDKYRVKYWLLERNAFEPEYISKNTWIQQYQPAAKIADSKLLQGSSFVLPGLIKSCGVVETGNLFLLEAECIKKGG